MYRLAICCLLASSVALADDPSAAERIGLEIGPDTTVISGPLNEFGYPNHLRYLDEQMAAGVTREENFWAGMWEACGNFEGSSPEFIQEVEAKLGIEIGAERKMVNIFDDPATVNRLGEMQGQASSRPWTRDEFPEIAEWLDANADELDLVHEAVTRPKAYSPLVCGSNYQATPMIAVLLPHVQGSRDVARQLTARAMLRLAEGDEAGAWDDLLTCHRLANHLGKGWTMIERLVGIAIHAMAQDPTALWLSQSTLPPDELLACWEELAPALAPISFAECVNVGERMMFVDTVLALQTGRVSSRELYGLAETPVQSDGLKLFETDILADLNDAKFKLYDLVMFASDINETLRYGNGMYDDLHRILLLPNHLDRVARMNDPEGKLAENAAIVGSTESVLAEYFLSSDEDFELLPARMMTGLLMPAIKQAEEAQTRMHGKAATLQAAFAVKIAIALTGETPADIASLRDLGNAVPPIPLDPYSGGELLLVEDPRGLVIYSVGTDGQDDNGFTFGDLGDTGADLDDQRAILTVSP
jgi:hypothetical protein